MTDIVTITESAKTKVMSEMEVPGDNLRLAVKGGGCSGMSYELFSESPDEYNELVDHTQDFNYFCNFSNSNCEFKVVIDQKSIIYLKGMELDYDGSMQGKGFVFRNPNAASTCGCGESFSVV